MFDFLNDLDEYFCEKYAGYDKLTVLSGYKMPVMQATKTGADGRVYAYTLPADTMRLAAQENKEELLAALKEKMLDKTFSFSFVPLSFFGRVKQRFSKFGFAKNFKRVLTKQGLSESDLKAQLDHLDVSDEILRGILKGKFLPSKNLILTVAFLAQLSFQQTEMLLTLCEYGFDYTVVKDVVAAYLLSHKIYNYDMVKAAFDEYKVANLYFKQ